MSSLSIAERSAQFAQIIGFAESSIFIINVKVDENGNITRKSKEFDKESRFAGKQLLFIATTLSTAPKYVTMAIKGKKVEMEVGGQQASTIPLNLWKDFQKEDYSKLVEYLAADEDITVTSTGEVSIDIKKYPSASTTGYTVLSYGMEGAFYRLDLPAGMGYTDQNGQEWKSISTFVSKARNNSPLDVWIALRSQLKSTNAPLDKIAEYYGMPLDDQAPVDTSLDDGAVEQPTAPAAKK